MTAPRFWLDDGEIVFDLADAPLLPSAEPEPADIVFLDEIKEEPMGSQPQAFSHEPVDAPRWIAWAVVALLLAALAVLLGGCCNHSSQAREVIGEARVLLETPRPGAPRWERYRLTFFEDAAKWEKDAAACCVEGAAK